MKKLRALMISALAMIIAIGGLWATSERDPSFQPYLTTFDGKPAIGQLHRDGWYSFYYANPLPYSAQWKMGSLIASFPSGEAAKLH